MSIEEFVVAIISGGVIGSLITLFINFQNLQANQQEQKRAYLVDRYNQLIDIFAEVETFLDCGMTTRHVESKTQDEFHQLGVFNFYIWKAKGLLLSINDPELNRAAHKLHTASRDEALDERLCLKFSESDKREENRVTLLGALEHLTTLIEGNKPSIVE